MTAANHDRSHGIVLLGHGARDPRWREPFDRLVAKVARLTPESQVRIAFLEKMKPDMASAVEELVAAGCLSVRVVPVFLGEGGHVREDVPRLIEAAQLRHPDAAIDLGRAVGEDDAVLDAIAAYCATS
jgi:sirohydrochlorin cobaltochelatase